MHQINSRGTFLVSQKCIPHLLRAANPHVLHLSPPPDFDVKWFRGHSAYTLAKFGMSIYAWAMAAEFKRGDQGKGGITFNCLWPRTAIPPPAAAAARKARSSGRARIGGDTRGAQMCSDCRVEKRGFRFQVIDAAARGGESLALGRGLIGDAAEAGRLAVVAIGHVGVHLVADF